MKKSLFILATFVCSNLLAYEMIDLSGAIKAIKKTEYVRPGLDRSKFTETNTVTTSNLGLPVEELTQDLIRLANDQAPTDRDSINYKDSEELTAEQANEIELDIENL
ncbi:MAG: hypothetical protein AB8E15_02805 [Bdellovibrionales bacterium]